MTSPGTKSTVLLPCLVVAVCVLAMITLRAFRAGGETRLFVQGCDDVVYSQMAQNIRQARAAGKPVDYFLDNEQTRALIAKLKADGLSYLRWKQVVGPHGYHYFPGSDQVGPQYPPGAPWAMSLFPRDHAMRTLSQISAVLLALLGLPLLAWCGARGLVFSCLVVTVAVYVFLYHVVGFNQSSYSVDAMELPLLLGTALAWIAISWRRTSGSLFLSFISGILFGLVMQDRVASVLLIPAIALVFLPRRPGLLAAFLTGVGLMGVLPLLLHDKTITGSYLGSTYDTGDREQSLGCILKNALFYLKVGDDLVVGLSLIVLILAGVLLIASTRRDAPWRSWAANHWGLILAPFVSIAISLAYFLTHKVAIPYYLTPGLLVACQLLALLFTSLEVHWRQSAGEGALRPGFSRVALRSAILLMILGVAFDGWGAGEAVVAAVHPGKEIPLQFEVPRELLAPRAWVWAGEYSGSIPYYTGHPGFKIFACSPEIRKSIYAWVKARGDSQYLVDDDPSGTMKRMIAEAQALGARTTLIGYIRDAPCYRLDLP